MPGHARTRIHRFHEYGSPDRVKLEEEPLTEPGHGDVRVKVQSIGLNRADPLYLANAYIESPRLPSRLGYEVCGIVEAVGPGVTGFTIGDRVSSIPAFSISDYANFGETATLPERGLVKTPDRLTPAQGASFAFAYYTTYFALMELARLQPYQTVLATAATSTTGQAAIPIIHKAGATVIATTRTGKERNVLVEAGVDHVVATEEEDLPARVMEITGGRGVAYDCVAGNLSVKIVQSTAIRGRWIVYGLMDYAPVPFPWLSAFVRSLRFDLYAVYNYTGNRHLGLLGDEEALARARHFVATGLGDGSLPPVPIDPEFRGLERLPEALEYMAPNQAAGKIVVAL